MGLVLRVLNNEEIMEIIILTCFEIESTVMGFHVYRNNWEPVMREVLKTCMKPLNEVDMYAVAFDDKNDINGYLPNEKSGRYANTIFYFLRSDLLNICNVKITGKAVNLGDSNGMRIPWLLQINAICKMMKILQ